MSRLQRAGCCLLNLDGKALRGTIPAGEKQGWRLLAVHEAEVNLGLAQTAVRKGENEISAAKRLLKEADLRGTIVSGDAILTQKELSRQVVGKGGDYLWRVKLNQEKLYRQIADFFCRTKGGRDGDEFEAWDKGHGRIERRSLSNRFAPGRCDGLALCFTGLLLGG